MRFPLSPNCSRRYRLNWCTVMLGGIQDLIRQTTYLRKLPPLGTHRVEDRSSLPCHQRMGAPAFAEPPYEDSGSSFKKNQGGLEVPFLEKSKYPRESFEETPLPNIYDNGHAVGCFPAFRGDLRERSDEGRRQVINAKIARILERFHGQGFTRTRQTRDKYKASVSRTLDFCCHLLSVFHLQKSIQSRRSAENIRSLRALLY